ncbi:MULTISPECIES: ParA family protein [Alphaproteobacteria]|uniref:Chromosome partitioning protein ParA n=2 Tax=Alphaproteobacteria TaxID=28211 RepID=A0A512HD61_9HYPH|nr:MULTISPECIES: ParA family protein [Alphaproteobacteria]GEO83387.1 chromosome partitioning protein ParA [Ciceribacter naphthalenivorans]GLR20219.1 chromosome partitioning protein ParA [Ciceribacter naphthalenivorans]GLT03075.1 chromosome partitioning protein ParA [Sphingomonas psychrolutea]
MPVLTFANTKGGAGKTTAALILACELAGRGNRVTILDADPRGWISRWHAVAGASSLISVAPVTEETIEALTAKARKRGGYILIDLPSSHDALLAKAVGLADHVLIPVQGCAMDAHGGAEVLELLKELDVSCGVTIPHSVVLTRVNAAVTTRALQAAKDLLASRGIATLSTPIAERAAYRDVFDKGGLLQAMNPAEVSNLSKALHNAAQLTDEIVALMPQKAAPRKPVAKKIAA